MQLEMTDKEDQVDTVIITPEEKQQINYPAPSESASTFDPTIRPPLEEILQQYEFYDSKILDLM